MRRGTLNRVQHITWIRLIIIFSFLKEDTIDMVLQMKKEQTIEELKLQPEKYIYRKIAVV
jgi:hypothetical protein